MINNQNIIDVIMQRKKTDILELDTNNFPLAQSKLLNNIVEELTKKIGKITQQLKSIQKEQSEQVMKCKLCGGSH